VKPTPTVSAMANRRAASTATSNRSAVSSKQRVVVRGVAVPVKHPGAASSNAKAAPTTKPSHEPATAPPGDLVDFGPRR
jgi:hypothetical protein